MQECGHPPEDLVEIVLQPDAPAIHSGLTDVLQVASVTFRDHDNMLTAQAGSDNVVTLDGVGEEVLVVVEPTKMTACEQCRRNIFDEAGRLCKRCEDVYERLNLRWTAPRDEAAIAEQEEKFGCKTKSRS